MNILEQFLEEKIKDQTDKSALTYKKSYNRIFAHFPEGKEPAQFTKEDFIQLLKKLNLQRVGSFAVTKSHIRDFIEWMQNKNLMSEQQLKEFSAISYNDVDYQEQFTLYYFKNFNELHSVFEQALELHYDGEDDYDSSEFDSARCALYLSWFGFTVEELCEIKKKDIHPSEPIIYKYNGGEKIPIQLNEKCIQYIRDYANKEYYHSRKFGGADIYYKSSIYLFRSCKSTKLTPPRFSAMLPPLNKFSEETGKRFTYTRIYQSGLYYRIYLYEDDNGKLSKSDYKTMAKVFGLPEEDLSSYGKKYSLSSMKYKQYMEYKNTFYN